MTPGKLIPISFGVLGLAAMTALAVEIGGGVMSGGSLKLKGALRPLSDSAMAGGGFTLRGSLVRSDGATEETLAEDRDRDERDSKIARRNDRHVNVVITDAEGFVVPGSEMVITLADDALPTLVSMDANSDSLVDYFALREDHDSLTALIAREDGRFDLLIDVRPESFAAALPRGDALENATIFSPQTAEDDADFDADARAVATLIRAAEEVIRDEPDGRTSNSAPLIVEIDDFDADGLLDFAITDPETGEMAYLHVKPESAGDAGDVFDNR